MGKAEVEQRHRNEEFAIHNHEHERYKKVEKERKRADVYYQLMKEGEKRMAGARKNAAWEKKH